MDTTPHQPSLWMRMQRRWLAALTAPRADGPVWEERGPGPPPVAPPCLPGPQAAAGLS